MWSEGRKEPKGDQVWDRNEDPRGKCGSGMAQPWGRPAGMESLVSTALFMTLTAPLRIRQRGRNTGITRTRDLSSGSLLKSVA